jgi:hypothetical protein
MDAREGKKSNRAHKWGKAKCEQAQSLPARGGAMVDAMFDAMWMDTLGIEAM